MDQRPDYRIHVDQKYGFLELVDVPGLVRTVTDPWFNQTLCRVNDCVVRVGVFREGAFHWHQHDEEDEFFFVLSGALLVDIEERTIRLDRHQGLTVPRGVVHRTRVEEPATVLMMEGAGVVPTGDE